MGFQFGQRLNFDQFPSKHPDRLMSRMYQTVTSSFNSIGENNIINSLRNNLKSLY